MKKSWIDLEMEHTRDRKVAKKIVEDHVKEFGCRYYPELKKVENKLKKMQDR